MHNLNIYLKKYKKITIIISVESQCSLKQHKLGSLITLNLSLWVAFLQSFYHVPLECVSSIVVVFDSSTFFFSFIIFIARIFINQTLVDVWIYSRRVCTPRQQTCDWANIVYEKTPQKVDKSFWFCVKKTSVFFILFVIIRLCFRFFCGS